MTKYSIKNICLGIGIGLILAAMVNINAAPKTLTREDVEREAKKLDLIVMNPKDLINKQPEVKNLEPAENEMVTIQIEAGATSQSVAKELFEAKLIQSEQKFLSRLNELEKENKMQIGVFKLSTDSTMDEIINMITSIPK